MAKVLLLNPPYPIKHFIRSARWAAPSISGSNWYPIWLAYAGGWLEKHGHKILLLDALVERLSPEKTLEISGNFHPDLTAIYTSTATLDSDVKISEMIARETDSRIIFVGPWCKVAPEEILNSSSVISAITIGEFDRALLDLANGKPLKNIKGICWKKDGEITQNPPAKPIEGKDLDQFPYVTDIYRHFLNLKKYFQAPQLYPFVDLYTGRSCDWGRCTFCLWPNTMNLRLPYRTRTIKNVIEELKFIKKKLSEVKEIFFQDDTLPAWRAKEISQAILEKRLKLTWSGYARAELDYETLKLMKRSGCRALHVGFESGVPRILKLMGKGVTVEQMEEFAYNAERLGIIIHADFILGLPGETKTTIKQTVAWAKKLPVHSYQITTPKVYPNTPLARYLEKNAPTISQEELRKLTGWALKQCHFNWRYIFRMLKYPKEIYRLGRSAAAVLPNLFLGKIN